MPALTFSISSRRCEDVPRPGRAVGELAGVGLGVVDHLLERLHADGRMDDEAADEVADPADGREVLRRVVGRLAQQRLHGERRVGREQKRVAVGRGLGRRLGADDAARPAAVLDHELLAEGLGELVGPGPADEIGGAARRVGEDQLDRPLRPALRLRPAPSSTRRPPASLPPAPGTRDDAWCLPMFFCRLVVVPAGCVRRSMPSIDRQQARCNPHALRKGDCLHRLVLGAIARQAQAATCKSTGGTLPWRR